MPCRSQSGSQGGSCQLRPDEAHKSRLGELLPELRQLAAAADKARCLGWQVTWRAGGPGQPSDGGAPSGHDDRRGDRGQYRRRARLCRGHTRRRSHWDWNLFTSGRGLSSRRTWPGSHLRNRSRHHRIRISCPSGLHPPAPDWAGFPRQWSGAGHARCARREQAGSPAKRERWWQRLSRTRRHDAFWSQSVRASF